MSNEYRAIRISLWGLMALFCFISLHAQNPVDSNKVRQLEEVQIGGDYFRQEAGAAVVQTLTSKQLQHLPTLQLSDALKYMSGVVIKDYGGAGGMKTISVRGLGAQHTGVAYDGIALTDCQTGQIDLGKLSLDHIDNIKLTTGLEEDLLQSARLFSFSNLLQIRTSGALPSKPLRLRVSMTMGSYGLYTPHVFCEHLIKSQKRNNRFFLWNLSANYTHAKGDYPYLLHYGGPTDSVSTERRQNSDVSAFNVEANARIGIDTTQGLFLKWYYYDSERGLPSAIVFYNPHSAQRLWNRNTFGQLTYFKYFDRRWAYLLNAKFNYDYTHYLDPDYLNEDGFLDNQYVQYEGYVSNTVKYKALSMQWGKDMDLVFALSNDLFYNQLNANTMECDHPQRITSLTALSTSFGNKRFSLLGNLLLTTVNNIASKVKENKSYIHLSPSIGGSVRLGQQMTLRVFYKNIFRMPTFNDLYYREVGNVDLEPEKTHQWNVGLVLDEQRLAAGRVLISASWDGYFNMVKDKIVAFPSHNLFSWTMLNYGLVWIGGSELNAHIQYRMMKDFWLRLNGNCSYQKAVDRTDPLGKTFNQQIPYTPLWSGSVGVSLDMPWVTISYSLIACGQRYALGQNIPANLVEGYFDQSITIGHTYHIKDVDLGFKCEFLNISNNNYEIIRNYPMQGFGWRLKVSLGW